MLELKKISKVYEVGNFKQQALKEISLSFRKCEFVSILGPSGSGKTTLLNIIGGLDNYTSGDLIINQVSTKKYRDKDWDSYRNHKVGFVFQSYNLIPHQSILANVELALTLSGVSKSMRRKKAKEALKEVGLQEHMNKRPNQLSGGQMQRVAIARALVNNLEIIMADEPTGALDSKTSNQIMDLLKKVAEDRLVIMVTHNADLAKEYSTRTIEVKDGVVLKDSNPYQGEDTESEKITKSKKKNMSFQTAFSLSLNNLMTKKGRTILTAFAGSIGIIGIALILSLSSGVQNYIEKVQEETLTSYPLTIEEKTVDFTSFVEEQKEKKEKKQEKGKVYSNDNITSMLSMMSNKVQTNDLNKFKKYLEENEKKLDSYISNIDYQYGLNLQLYKGDTSNGMVQVNPNNILEKIGMPSMEGDSTMNQSMAVFSKLFDNEKVNQKMYQVVSGRMPEKYDEMVLLVDEKNQISDYILYALGIKDSKELDDYYDKVMNGEKFEISSSDYQYEDLIGLSYKLLLNTDYYEKVNSMWIDKRNNMDYIKEKLENALEIKIVGIIKPNEDSSVTSSTYGGVLYTKELEEYVIATIQNQDIVKEQRNNKDTNVLTGLPFSKEEFNINNLTGEQKMYLQTLSPEELTDFVTKYKEQQNATYESVLRLLGAVDMENPTSISIYLKDFESREKIKDIIKDYGEKNGNIHYNDFVGMMISSVTVIVDMISYVLIGFVSISLIVSSIMIGIITYISVLERTKEIGILRAIGASKKDVSRVFNAETLIVGLGAGILGIFVTILLNIPINSIIYKVAEVKHLSSLPPVGGIVLIIISVILTVVAGLIPAKMASKKDPVEALRSE